MGLYCSMGRNQGRQNQLKKRQSENLLMIHHEHGVRFWCLRFITITDSAELPVNRHDLSLKKPSGMGDVDQLERRNRLVLGPG